MLIKEIQQLYLLFARKHYNGNTIRMICICTRVVAACSVFAVQKVTERLIELIILFQLLNY